ncbi:unnamed protein product, partial [Polarella glacialis]
MELPFVSWSSPSSSTASQSWRLASSASVPISRSPSLGWPQVDPAPSPCYAAAGAVLLTAALGVSCQRPVASRASLPRRRQLVGLRADAEQGGQDSGASASQQQQVSARNHRAKWLTFWACFFGYSVCYFTRQSLSYTAPVLRQAMGWKGLTELGQLSSLFPLAYGSSRFLGGVLGDLMSPKKVFVLGLSVCSLLNIAFGLSSTLPQFAFFWFLNGCFQGLVAPPCVKMITNWFDPKERGFWWSVWHASINVGGFLIPFFAGGLAQSRGWRYGMLGPGVLGLATAAICYALMSDGPEGAPSVVKQATAITSTTTATTTAATTATAAAAGEKGLEKGGEKAGKISLMEGVVLNPNQWALGLAYLLVYVCRQGLGIWGIFYLMHAGAPDAARAAALFSGFELGGFLGNLTAGLLSDLLLRRAKPGEGEAGQRAKVVCGYFVATALLMGALAQCPGNLPMVQYVLLLGLGHFLCGSQLLLPLIAAETAPKAWSTTATGFIGWVGYFGAALSGLPLARVVAGQNGWSSYFAILTTAAGLGAGVMVPLLGLKSWRQRV